MNIKNDSLPLSVDNAELIKGLKVLRIIWGVICALFALALDALVFFSNRNDWHSAKVLFGFAIPWVGLYFMAFRVFKFERTPKSLVIDSDGVHLCIDGRPATFGWNDIEQVKILSKDNVTGGGTSIPSSRIKIITVGSIDRSDATGTIDDEFGVPMETMKKLIETGISKWQSPGARPART
jgi:hypothetical protein